MNAEDVSTRALAQTCEKVAVKLLDTASASTLDKSWLNAERGEERVNLLSREVQLDLTSIWVESCDKGEWERFANHRALRPSNRLLGHKSMPLRAALLQLQTPNVESVGARAYARLRDDRAAGALIENQSISSHFFTVPPSHQEIMGIPIPGQRRKRPLGARQDPLQSFELQSVRSLCCNRPIIGHGEVKNRR